MHRLQCYASPGKVERERERERGCAEDFVVGGVFFAHRPTLSEAHFVRQTDRQTDRAKEE